MLTGLRLYAALGGAGLVLAAFGGAYWKGRADCGARQKKLTAAAELVWERRVSGVRAEAIADLLAHQKQETEDRKDLNDIVKKTPATGVCVPADTVERLRKLQAD
jgi:hypothetical protein